MSKIECQYDKNSEDAGLCVWVFFQNLSWIEYLIKPLLTLVPDYSNYNTDFRIIPLLNFVFIPNLEQIGSLSDLSSKNLHSINKILK